MRKFSPRTARTDEQVCSLRRDNFDVGDFWIMVDEDTVHITAQAPGEPATAEIMIPKSLFNRMIAFYNRPTRAKP